MPQVICNLQNMSGSVSGVAFTRAPDSDGPWQSEPVSEAMADLLASIPGYERLPEPDPIPAEPEPTPVVASPAPHVKKGSRNG